MSHLELPKIQTAIITQDDLKLGVSEDVPPPQLFEPGMILIKTMAVGLNPTDFKMPSSFPSPGAIDGCDFAGTIIKLDPGVTRPLKLGDKVFGAVHGANPKCHQSGAFAEYVAADAEHVFLMPEGMSWAKAAGMGGAAIGTVRIALYQSLGLAGTPEKPAEKPTYVLLNGGSTATGAMPFRF
jgi:NADPH:quinone reductase-like Zn-dependent oxidoreductase